MNIPSGPHAELRDKIDIALALGGDVMDFNDLCEMARTGRVQLWLADRETALIATEIVNYPRKRVMHCFMAAGSLPGIFSLRDKIETFARDEDIDCLTCSGSPAWGRLGRRYGWRLHSMTFVRNLKGH